MGLINYEQLGAVLATPNLWNTRFGKIYDEFNGKIDDENLKNGAVTTPKLATGSVTNEKLADNTIEPGKLSAVAFRAKSNSAQVTTADEAAKVLLPTVTFDYGNNFNEANSEFIAPVRGVYQFNGRVSFASAEDLNNDLLSVSFRINGTTEIRGTALNAAEDNTHSLVAAATVFLEAGDTFQLWMQRNTSNGTLTPGQSDFSGFCVGAITE